MQEIIRIYERASVGDWQDRPLSWVGHIFSIAGVPRNQALPLLLDIQDVRFCRCLDKAKVLAEESLPPAAHSLLEPGLALAKSGAVTLNADGTASVHTQSGEYRLNGACDCAVEGAPTLPDGRPVCEHLIAVWLVRRANQLKDANPTG